MGTTSLQELIIVTEMGTTSLKEPTIAIDSGTTAPFQGQPWSYNNIYVYKFHHFHTICNDSLEDEEWVVEYHFKTKVRLEGSSGHFMIKQMQEGKRRM